MQSKGVVRFFLIALSLVCLYQFALIIPTNNVESAARRYADDRSAKVPDVPWRTHYSQFLDSLSSEPVFEIPLIKKFTYADLKKSQLAMGLDLKGGMSVLLQVDLQDFLKSLAANTTDPAFQEALDKATIAQSTQPTDYITLFANAWKETGKGKSLASVFARNESLKGQINFESPDAEVIRVIRDLANTTVGETYKRLKQRIDKLGVVQPNVSLDAGRDLILVELPGIDNPKRAREMLQRSAKLEFWDTYRVGDEGIGQAMMSADARLQAIMSGDSSAQAALAKKDTTYVYPPGPDGKPDSTATPEIKVADKPAVPGQTTGPLLSQLTAAGEAGSVMIGYADKNKTKAISEMLNRTEIRGLFPPDIKFLWSLKSIEDQEGVSADLVGKYQLYAIKKWRNQDKARLDGGVVTSASEQPDPTSNEITVSLAMNNEGARIWAEMTRLAYDGGNREIAIVLDDEVVSAPSVINPIEGGNSSITGNFTLEEAQDLANILEVGKLPAGTHIVQESQVGPSLGEDNIQKSLIALILSVVLICGFMIAYYARGGIISVLALLINIFFIIGTLASMGTVLTLPGIAGIVLILASAVDANVIIYERIREELRSGMSNLKAIAVGFSRGLPAIIDANVTTALTAVVLVYFGLGPIKGFGTVLLVGIVSSMFTAVLVGRLMTDWWSERSKGAVNYSHPWSSNWLVGINVDWISKRKWAYLFSISITVLGIVSFAMRGFELGVDFKGGYSFNVQFEKPIDEDQLRPALSKALGGNPIIKAVSIENTYNITTSYLIDDLGDDVMDRVMAKMHEGILAAGVTTELENFKNTAGSGTHITSSNKVSPTVADDIKNSSFRAGFWGLALIFLYLLFRFRRWQFSMGAVIALFHDVLITLTFFTLLHGIVPFSLEIDQAIIACILTVMGFSVNDTVIVYDRIREFINTYTGRRKEEVLNLAINTTLSRTLITSGTILAASAVLFFFGGDATKGFSFGMTVGILFGTYSSIFVASALVVDLTKEKVLAGKEATEAKSAASSYSKKQKAEANK